MMCKGASYTLVSVPQVCMERGPVVIMDSHGAVAVISDDYVKSEVKEIKTYSSDTNQLIFTAHLTPDSCMNSTLPSFLLFVNTTRNRIPYHS